MHHIFKYKYHKWEETSWYIALSPQVLSSSVIMRGQWVRDDVATHEKQLCFSTACVSFQKKHSRVFGRYKNETERQIWRSTVRSVIEYRMCTCLWTTCGSEAFTHTSRFPSPPSPFPLSLPPSLCCSRTVRQPLLAVNQKDSSRKNNTFIHWRPTGMHHCTISEEVG